MTFATKPCFHCGLPTPIPVQYFAEVNGVAQPMCCPGCQAVTEAIIAGGLENYYQYRTEHNFRAKDHDTALQETLAIYDQPEVQQTFVRTISADTERPQQLEASLLIDGITCAACVWLLETYLSQLEGIDSVSVNLTTHEAKIRWQPEQCLLSSIMLAVHHIGYQPLPWQAEQQEALLKNENRRFIRRLAVAGIAAMQVMMYAIALYSGAISQDMPSTYQQLIRLASAVMATPVVFYSAVPFFKSAWRDIRFKHLGMDVPVAIAIGGAYTASLWATFIGDTHGTNEVYFDSVTMFTFFLLCGRYLEMRARHSTLRAARILTQLTPPSCLRILADGITERIASSTLQINDHVRVLSGDTLPADGVLLQGHSSVDESMLSGEYLPIEKQQGDTLLCSSINIEQPIDMRVTQVGETTQIAAITRLLKQAQLNKPTIAKLADRVAQWFVAGVLLTSIIVFFVWHRIDAGAAFWVTLSVLVVTCPCALSLATPTALTAASGRLHRSGLLVIQNHFLEGLKKITHVVFDKTGTLTKGELTLIQTLPVDSNKRHQPDAISYYQHIAAALEAHSEHPIAKAFTPYHIESALIAEDVTSHTACGVSGKINGVVYRIGKPDFACPDHALPLPSKHGQWLLLAHTQQPLCWFELQDEIRADAKNTIAQLQLAGKQVSILSGDRAAVVNNVAQILGIAAWQAEMSPAQKLTFIRQCQRRGDKVLMVGDGINDIPVLAGANLSIAMANASDLARTNADAVLISNRISSLITIFQTADKTNGIIRQNLLWALTYNVVALPLAAAGWITPWMAAIGMTSSSLLVCLNALRLNR